MEHDSLFAELEAQLTRAAELVLSGTMPEALYAASVHGLLAKLPMPAALG